MLRPTRTLLTACLTVLAAAALSRASEYQVDRTAENSVVFISDAPIEDFEGTTDRIDGYVLFDGDSLDPQINLDSSEVYFEVDLASLDTGIGLRNRHMRENYLETDQYPYATYAGRIEAIESCAGDSCVIVSSGTMTIHGTAQAIELRCITRRTAVGYRVESEFVVKLPDYKIEVPSLMFMKISEEIALRLDFALARVGTTAAR